MKQLLLSVLVLVVTAFLLGCASYRPDSLPRIDSEFAPYVESVDQVTVSAKLLTKAECKQYLDRDVIVKGYQPILVSIDNQSDSPIVFSPSRVSLPCANPNDVAKRVHTSTSTRVVAWGVPALFIWPLLIPAIVDGIGSSNANRDLDTDFAAKALGEVVIQPKSSLKGLLFVPTESFTPGFELTLLDRDSKKQLEFNVAAK
jgi:hypothetical protein